MGWGTPATAPAPDVRSPVSRDDGGSGRIGRSRSSGPHAGTPPWAIVEAVSLAQLLYRMANAGKRLTGTGDGYHSPGGRDRDGGGAGGMSKYL
jgi:hypothetical protein